MDPKHYLITPQVRAFAANVADDFRRTVVQAACAEFQVEDTELLAAIEARDAGALEAVIAGWANSSRRLPKQDQAVFKRALKAFRKRLKLMRLDDESSIAGGPMSGGRSSSIIAIHPPDSYPQEVWDELVHIGRLVDAGDGLYELPAD